MNAKFFLPVSGSTRSLSANILYASMSDVDGVIGYHAPTVAPANTQPSPAAVLPSMRMWPRGLRAAEQARRHVHAAAGT